MGGRSATVLLFLLLLLYLFVTAVFATGQMALGVVGWRWVEFVGLRGVGLLVSECVVGFASWLAYWLIGSR